MNNNYPKWWDTTITVYNKYTDPQTKTIKWFRTVLNNCFWKYTNDKVFINNTILDSNVIKCRIPKDERFLEKFEWVKLPNDKMSDFFTLGLNDIILKGEVDDEIDEYVSGKRSTDFINKYKELQGCMVINLWTDNTGDVKNNEHYYAQGI